MLHVLIFDRIKESSPSWSHICGHIWSFDALLSQENFFKNNKFQYFQSAGELLSKFYDLVWWG